jgi:hypothetical protein
VSRPAWPVRPLMRRPCTHAVALRPRAPRARALTRLSYIPLFVLAPLRVFDIFGRQDSNLRPPATVTGPTAGLRPVAVLSRVLGWSDLTRETGDAGCVPAVRPRCQNAKFIALSPRPRHNTICIRSRRPTRLGHVPGIGAGGVEPPASAFVVRCSIHLSYAPGCRGGRIRTCDLLVPNQARCQIAPRLDDMQLCAIHPRHWHIPLTKCVYLAPWLPSETAPRMRTIAG